MMIKLLQRYSAAMKDNKSICLAKVGWKRGFRNPDLETAVIRATSHDQYLLDYKNAQRVFDWVRTSPAFLRPLVWALTKRLDKTHSWVVALKSLMLVHGVFSTNIPTTRMIGRLPFDLSDFRDRSSSLFKSWGYNAFIRAYFAFLDLHSTFLSYYREEELQQHEQPEKDTWMQKSLLRLHRSQELLDLLLQIKPCTDNMEVGLVLEAMDCIVIEAFDVYTDICSVISSVIKVSSPAATAEAVEALEILQKAESQGSQLSAYLQVCREMGVVNAWELPCVKQMPEEDISELERRIAGGVSRKMDMGFVVVEEVEVESAHETKQQRKGEDNREKGTLKSISKSTVTENWVIFYDESPALWI